MTNILQDYLARAYGQTDIHQVPKSARRICIDDYGSDDHSLVFCHIHVYFNDDDSFDLQLTYAPTNAAVLQLVEEWQGKITDNGVGKDIRLHLYASQWPFILELANAIKQVVARGANYKERNWKWICPRTAASLEKLAARLKEYEEMREAGTLPTYEVAVPVTAKAARTSKAKTTRKRERLAVPTENDDDDEENLFKICGVE